MKNAVFWDVSLVALVITDVSKDRSASIISVTPATRRNIPEDTILHSHRRENLKS
jgi:hypothetical protein